MSDALERGIVAAKSGDKALAGQYLQQAIQENPNNITAWLWLSTIVDKPEQKKYCFQKVLSIDPGNDYALKGLNALDGNVKQPDAVGKQEQSAVEQKPFAAPEQPQKRFEYLGSYEATYIPRDIYEPYLPGVDVYSDMEFFFENARLLGQKAARKGFIPEFLKAYPEFNDRIVLADAADENQKYVSLISPDRMVWLLPAPMPNVNNKNIPIPDNCLPKHKKRLKITAIGYNKMAAILNPRAAMELSSEQVISVADKCIPFLGIMLAYAGILGHSILIFEGHPAAFEAGVKNSDVLFIDSAMLDFLQGDWGEVAFRTMAPHAKIYVHNREEYKLLPVMRKDTSPGWEVGIGPGDENAYINLFLTFLAKNKLIGQHFQFVTGKPLPSLLLIAHQPVQKEFISKIPFDYECMDVKRIIDWLVARSKPQFLSSTRVFTTSSGLPGQNASIDSFNLQVTEEKNGQTKMELWLTHVT